MDLNVTETDWEQLLKRNPLAAEQIQNIVLERMLIEANAKIASLNGKEQKTEKKIDARRG